MLKLGKRALLPLTSMGKLALRYKTPPSTFVWAVVGWRARGTIMELLEHLCTTWLLLVPRWTQGLVFQKDLSRQASANCCLSDYFEPLVEHILLSHVFDCVSHQDLSFNQYVGPTSCWTTHWPIKMKQAVQTIKHMAQQICSTSGARSFGPGKLVDACRV